MALSMPVDLDTFFRALPIAEMTWDTVNATEALTLGSGEVLTAEHGVALWQGSVTLASQDLDEYEEIMVLVRALKRAGGSFLAAPMHRPQVLMPSGVTLLAVSGRTARFAGLSAGFVVRRGTFFAFTYGSSPTRWAFHQLAEEVTADGSGNTPAAEVDPPIRPGYSLGVAIDFTYPRVKAVMVPGTVRAARLQGIRAEGATFDWRQTLR